MSKTPTKSGKKALLSDFSNPDLNVDDIVSSYIDEDNFIGITTILESLADRLTGSALLDCICFIVKNHGSASIVEKYYDRLEKDFPAQLASVKAYILVSEITKENREQKCNEAIQILENALKKDRKNPQLLFNIAYVNVLQNNKENAYKTLKKSFNKKKDPYASSILLLIRILRSNCQTDEALSIANAAFDLLGRYDRNITIEGMFVAAEKGDISKMEFFFQKLKKNYKNDKKVMEAATKINLMLGKVQDATDCFQKWSKFDKESSDFFFCCAQLCLAAMDSNEALRNLSLANQLDPLNAEILANMATVYYKSGSKDRAYEIALAATKIDPTSIHAWLALSTVSTDDAEAKNALNYAIALRRSFVDLSGLSLILNE